jgi:hypothetical protein
VELNVVLCMASNDRRFGFSVVGGVDEGVRPRVDDVQPGKCEMFHNAALRFNFSFSQTLL